jgi:tRNA(fMet)-specific endonuclease VapC
VKICLDTNVFTKLALQHQPLIELIDQSESVFVPTVVLGELYAGFYLGNRQDQNKKDLLQFLNLPGVEEVVVDSSIAERYGIIIRDLKKAGKPIPTNDIWIAATALELGARLVSYDKHFDLIAGLIVIAP